MLRDLGLLLARLLLGSLFVMAAIAKLSNVDGTAGYIGSVGLPAPVLLAWAAALFETIAGIAILVGFQTKIAALLLAAFCVFAGFVFHFQPSDQMQMISFMKNLTIAGGFLTLWVAGPGSISVDARRGGTLATA